ncbi:hypothetical protein ACFC6U_36290, partial [Kitasatospora purpeofusca]
MSPEPAADHGRAERARRLVAQSAALGARPVRRLAGPIGGPTGPTGTPAGTPSGARTGRRPGRRPSPRTGPRGPERAAARLVARSTRATLAGLPTTPPSPHWRP